MSGQTYKTRCIVLRKTKLGEKDLVVTLLAEDGALRRAVAKGARKPGGSYAARIELFSIVDIMCAKGRSLDIITSAKLAGNGKDFVFGIEQAACASALAELLAELAQEDLPHAQLYAMAERAFKAMACTNPITALALTCSSMLKALAYAGFRPMLDSCISCGVTLDLPNANTIAFSLAEGGACCPRCQTPVDAQRIAASTLSWTEALMLSRFDDVLSFEPGLNTLFDVLQLIGQWTRFHVGKNLKSIDFIMSSGLF